MADNWLEYFYGSPEQQMRERESRQKQFQEISQSPYYQALSRLTDNPLELDGRSYDPREMRMAMVQDTLQPGVQSDYGRHLQETPGKAYSAVFESTMRPRDTLIKAAQAANQGEYGNAALLGLRAPLSIVYPPAAAGTPGSEDDWRDDAERLGISAGNIMAIDLMTDPETYLATPLPFLAAGRVARGAGRAAKHARVFDQAGDMVRKLRSGVR